MTIACNHIETMPVPTRRAAACALVSSVGGSKTWSIGFGIAMRTRHAFDVGQADKATKGFRMRRGGG